MLYMTKAKTRKGEKLSYPLVKDVLIKIVQRKMEEKKEKESEEDEEEDEDERTKLLITVNEVSAELKIDHDIEVSRQSIRNWGFSPRGYFPRMYSKSMKYNKKGDTTDRGMVVLAEKFLEKMEEEDRI